MSRREIEERVRRIGWPAPPPGLRDRVLSTAVVAGAPISWSDRLWFSRGWRLAALAAALVVIALDQVSTVPQSTDVTAAPYAIAQARAIDEAARQAGLPPDAAASFARRALAEASRPMAQSGPAALQAFELAGGTQ
jgi:hypothetical protein